MSPTFTAPICELVEGEVENLEEPVAPQNPSACRTLSAIPEFGISDRVSYISTGGGACLEFLEGK